MKNIIELKVEEYYSKILNSKPLSEDQIEKLGEYMDDISDILYEMEYISNYPDNEPIHDKDTIRQSDFVGGE